MKFHISFCALKISACGVVSVKHADADFWPVSGVRDRLTISFCALMVLIALRLVSLLISSLRSSMGFLTAISEGLFFSCSSSPRAPLCARASVSSSSTLRTGSIPFACGFSSPEEPLILVSAALMSSSWSIWVIPAKAAAAMFWWERLRKTR